MKKIIYGMFIFLISSTLVHASNEIYNIDMDIYLDEQGNANITEVWDVKGSDGTEWYKGYANMGYIDLADFTVSMDGVELTKKVWNVDESLSEKKGYYGVNTTSNGFELCFGKYDYKRHKFTLKYTLTNMVFNTEDAQVVYNTFIDRLSSVNFENFHIKISSYYEFPDNLDVWGYGYKGYAYVKDGIIEASNEGSMNGNYVVLLVKFPSETFDTNIGYSSYQTFNDVYNRAEQGTFDYDYDEEGSSFLETLFGIITTLAPFIFIGIGIVAVSKSGYGYVNNKVIDKKNTPFFRDIPCNKDIYYANTLTKLNSNLFTNYKETNILGAIMLKWVREDKIKFIKEEKSGILGKEKSSIDLRLNPTFDNVLEKELFDTMYKASGDGILETKELEKWARKNYSKFFDLFKRIYKLELLKLESNKRNKNGLTDSEFITYFTKDKPVIFNFHGYPSLIHGLIYDRPNKNFYVHGYEEEGSITTAFDMRLRNKIDRFTIVQEVLENIPQTTEVQNLKEYIAKEIEKHYAYVKTNGIDLDEITNWNF